MTPITRTTRALSNDERLAQWAYKFYGAGHHRSERKPRVRVKPRIRVVARAGQ